MSTRLATPFQPARGAGPPSKHIRTTPAAFPKSALRTTAVERWEAYCMVKAGDGLQAAYSPQPLGSLHRIAHRPAAFPSRSPILSSSVSSYAQATAMPTFSLTPFAVLYQDTTSPCLPGSPNLNPFSIHHSIHHGCATSPSIGEQAHPPKSQPRIPSPGSRVQHAGLYLWRLASRTRCLDILPHRPHGSSCGLTDGVLPQDRLLQVGR